MTTRGLTNTLQRHPMSTSASLLNYSISHLVPIMLFQFNAGHFNAAVFFDLHMVTLQRQIYVPTLCFCFSQKVYNRDETRTFKWFTVHLI